jgi:cell division protein FtsI (penicillin-binding protein 3)
LTAQGKNKSKKIFLLYTLLSIGFLIFLGVMLSIVVSPRNLPSLYTKNSSYAMRGNIISADGFTLAHTTKLYKAVVNTRFIDPDKKELFIELFSIYSGIKPDTVRKKLSKRNGVVVLSYNIEEKHAQYLKKLAYELRRYKVFISRTNPRTGIKTLQGLNIIESGESREYPYKKLLTPVIGYTHKIEDDGYTKIKGVKGIEKRFEAELEARQDELSQGKRDVNGYIILNKDSFTKRQLDGLNVKLNIPASLQIRMERMLDEMKIELDANQVMLAIMDTSSGKVISMASSNRYLPKDIRKEDYPSLNSAMLEYSFEPGSVIKTITFALLLDKKLINPYDLVNGHNGRFKIGRKIITDEHEFDWLSAENVIVHSSNIGIAQLAQKMSGIDFYEGLKDFGFASKSTPDMIYERKGSLPQPSRLENEIYKATCSYGYGMHANLMQLLRAYSVFNNSGKSVTPQIVDSFINELGEQIKIPKLEEIQVIEPSTAHRVKQILVKTVNKGTGVKAITPGLEIGGKTGTAHKVEDGSYVNKYNTAFLGFANDKKNKYTIGVVVIEPKKSQFASQTAVPVFKRAVDILVDNAYLKPDVIK